MGMWEILEEGRDDYGRGFGMRGDEVEEAYKEGCRKGYEKAMREMRGEMGFRGYVVSDSDAVEYLYTKHGTPRILS